MTHHPQKFHDCHNKFCIKDEIERRIRKKVDEIMLLLVQELKTMIQDFRVQSDIDMDQILEDTCNELKLNFNQVHSIGDDFTTKIQILS